MMDAALSKVLVDTNATKGDTAVIDYWPSPDGTQVAYGTAEGGTENTTIHFVEVSSGRVMPDALPYAGGVTTPASLVFWHSTSVCEKSFPLKRRASSSACDNA